ncbi:hypothetical protein SAMN00017405_0117 [Desulfonispora thiosulfatigenes DSM 11270]|uniref:Uncharacterized protein n=1 Tax=Desulfonispora thiosulfatigenes DSM 11270 TaxID=656914 RepID=A0A1W1VKV1_DESTI|nr:hypothetical protein [Desulfonispora thiosulfatigenes]SMB93926.1 hypothetical protein SAMN00017405_0117 [Desulfonispora thiosulfatigenes DSM 11270]
MNNLSNCIYLKNSRVYVSRNNDNWYRVVLSYDSDHPEANYYLAKELEGKKRYSKAYEHYKLAYAGGYASAISGLNRLKELKQHKINPEQSDLKHNSSLALILFLLLLLLIGSIITYYIFNPIMQRENLKVFNLKEVEQVVKEKEVLLHNIPVRRYYAPTLFDNNGYYDLKVANESSMQDILVTADKFLESKKTNQDLEEISVVFYYADTLSELNNEYAIAEVIWTKDYGIKDLYLYPDFKKKQI